MDDNNLTCDTQAANKCLPCLPSPLYLGNVLPQPTLRILLATLVYTRRRFIRLSHTLV